MCLWVSGWRQADLNGMRLVGWECGGSCCGEIAIWGLGSWHCWDWLSGGLTFLDFFRCLRFAVGAGRIPALCLQASGEPSFGTSPLSARLLAPDVSRELAFMHLFLR